MRPSGFDAVKREIRIGDQCLDSLIGVARGAGDADAGLRGDGALADLARQVDVPQQPFRQQGAVVIVVVQVVQHREFVAAEADG